MERHPSAGATLAVVCGLSLIASGVNSHIGTKVFPIYEVPPWAAIDVRDGSLDDWEEIAPGPSMTMADFEFYQWPSAAYNPANTDIRVYLAWSGAERRIYAGFERFDDIYHPYPGGDPILMFTSYDGVTFAVDGDHTGGQYAFGSRRDLDTMSVEEARLRTWMHAQRYAATAESPDGRQLTALGESLGFEDWLSLPPYGDAGGATEDVSDESPLPGWPYHRSVIELYVTPWDSLAWRSPEGSIPSQLQTGRIIGFHVFVADFDSKPGVWEYWYLPWGTSPDHNYSADAFVDGQLLPCGPCGDPPTAIASQSWARIKAGFRLR